MKSIKFRFYDIVQRAVEEGVAYGYHRAHKHSDSPNENQMKQEVEQAVMFALSEIIDFEDAVIKEGAEHEDHTL